ncbi:MAG: hypothetical protein AAF851_15405 [Myxococcota bacterium]
MSHGLIPGLALVAWFPFTFWLVRTYRLPVACAYSLIGGALILPNQANYDFPLVPALSKATIPALAFLMAVYFRDRQRLRATQLGKGLEGLWLALALGALCTWWTNRNTIYLPGWLGPPSLLGLKIQDAWNLSMSDLMFYILPFCAGRVAVHNLDDFRSFARSTITLGILYVPLVLLELRLSPQTHKWVYGFAAQVQSFSQSMRWGGYRPNLFFPHGLGLAMFLLAVLLLIAGLYRSRKSIFGMRPRWFFFAYCAIVILEKATGAIAYAVMVVPLIVFAPARLQRWTIISLAVFGLYYPTALNSLPRHELSETIASYSFERGSSLQFRFDNEDLLAERANEKFLFGWGAFGRNRVYHPRTGLDIAVTDGAWIVRFGQQGYVGMAFSYLLLIIPVISLMRQLKRHRLGKEEYPILGASFYVALSSVEMIPNGLLSFYIPFFMAGGLAGLARHFRATPTVQTRRTARAPVA